MWSYVLRRVFATVPTLPVSTVICGGAIFIARVVGMLLDTLAALRQNSVVDYRVMLRGSPIEVLHSNSIRTARARDLPLHQVIGRHVLKFAMLPVVSVLGLLAMLSISSAIVSESFFSPPGLGQTGGSTVPPIDYTLVLVLGLVVLITAVALEPPVRSVKRFSKISLAFYTSSPCITCASSYKRHSNLNEKASAGWRAVAV